MSPSISKVFCLTMLVSALLIMTVNVVESCDRDKPNGGCPPGQRAKLYGHTCYCSKNGEKSFLGQKRISVKDNRQIGERQVSGGVIWDGSAVIKIVAISSICIFVQNFPLILWG